MNLLLSLGRKDNLIKCLTFRALKTCSDNKIESEFEQIKNLFLGNGYPEEVIVDTINKTVDKFNIRPFGPTKCPVYVRLPWTRSPSQLIVNKVSSSVTHCYNAAIVRTIFTTAFRSTHKDVFSIFQQSNLIYKFQCCCNATYIGHTSQCLEVRVKQHVPRDIHNCTTLGQNCSILPSVSICML